MLNHACSELIHRCANPSQTRPEPRCRRRSASTTSRGENARQPRSSCPPTCRRAPRRSSRTSSSSGPTRDDPGRVLLFQSTPSSDSSERAGPGRHRHLARARGRVRGDRHVEGGDRQPRPRQPAALADGLERRPARVPRLPGRRLPGRRHAATSPTACPNPRCGWSRRSRTASSGPTRARTARSSCRASRTRSSPTRSTASSAACSPAHGCPWGWVRMIDIARRDAPGARRRVPAAVERARDLRAAAAGPRPRRQLLGPQPDADAEPRASSPGTGPGSRRSTIADPTQPQLGRAVPARAAAGRPDRGPGAEPGPRQGRDVELPGHQGRADLRRRHPQRPLHPALPRARSSGEVARIGFLDGNSNSGDAARFE